MLAILEAEEEVTHTLTPAKKIGFLFDILRLKCRSICTICSVLAKLEARQENTNFLVWQMPCVYRSREYFTQQHHSSSHHSDTDRDGKYFSCVVPMVLLAVNNVELRSTRLSQTDRIRTDPRPENEAAGAKFKQISIEPSHATWMLKTCIKQIFTKPSHAA